MTATFLRQLTTLLTKNKRLLIHRPLHLLNLLLSSIPAVLLAYAAGRNGRGPSGDFPPLTSCGMVDPLYSLSFQNDWMAMQNIPITMNEAWRDGLPVWILSLGAVFSGISVFLIVRSELASKRWGALRSAGLRDSVYWISWFLCFAMCGIVNSLLGGIVAVFLPVHVFQHVSFGVVFGLLLFLNLAIAAASFVLAAACGTVQSATLTVVVVIGMICAGAAPCMAIVFSRGYFDASDATNTYGFNWGDGGSFWVYASTERTQVEYLNFTYNSTTYQYDYGEPTLNQCEVPLLSFDQGRTMKTADERNNVPLEDVFTGCFVIPGASTTFLRDKGLFFFWYLLPQTHFTMAWSNILGFTGLPHSDNTFSLTQATKPPELLAADALSNYLTSEGSVLLDPDTNGPSLFPEGSTALPEYYYWYDYYYDGPALNNCPSTEVIDNLCLGDYNWTSTSCYYTNSHYPSSSSPSVSNSIGYMASLVVIYLVMAFYIGAVFPMSNGAALKFYFPFQSGFWRRGRFLGDDEKNSSDDVETGIVLDGESKNAPEVGVEAVNVSKSYGKVEALKPFSIKLNVGEVTSLLGHNGAGKSTFVNMLCCEQNPSGGDIKVFGNSVKSSPHYVRSLLGECYQDDYLYPELSAQDHLELFAGIRGLASDKVESDVQLWLQSVDLELVKDNATSTFSGGMKRRLSVALSTIGPSKLIVLDEPTTGMDPISRRFVWDHITTIKPDRVILLTTHAMDEADLLSDEVVIVCDGKLVASGSPLELKHQYGSAVQLSIISGKQHAEEVSARIASHFATAQEWIDSSSSDSGYITLNIKKIKRISEDEGVEPSSLASFIGWIEGEDSPVQEFSLSNSSLEEVFLAVTKNHHPVNQSSNQEMISKGCCCCRKNKPQTVAEEVNTANVVSAADIGMHLENQPQATLSNFSRNLSVKMQTVALVRFYLKRNWSGRPSKVNWIVYGFFSIGNLCLGLGLAALWPYEAIYYFLLLTVFFLSMIMISLISPIYSDRNLGLQKMMEMQSLFRSSFLLGTSIYSLVVSFVYTFVVLTLFFATPIYRDADTPDCSSGNNFNDTYTGYETYDYECGYGSFGSKPVVHPAFKNLVLSGQYNGEEVNVYAHQGAGGYGMMFGIILVFSLTFPGAVLSSSFFPGYKVPLIGVSMIMLVACVSPFILTVAKSVEPYFIGNCTEAIVNDTSCSQFSFDLDNANSTFVECVGQELLATNLNLLISCLPTEASILPQIGLFHTLSLSLMSSVVFYSEPANYAAEVFVPNLKASCSGNSCAFDYVRTVYGSSLGYMFLGAVLLLVLGISISYIAIYPIPILIRLRHKLRDWLKQGTHVKVESTLSDEKEMEEVSLERMRVDTFLAPIIETRNSTDANSGSSPMLSHSVTREAKDSLPPVLTNKLQKVYTTTKKIPPKVALDSLDLHVPYGEVLGLLGKNGAGKTTALKILAGMENATSGIGLVAGYDVEEERIAVYERLGNCPQFDIVWRAQSVKAHLEFYARLKGVDEPEKAALEIATAVGLGDPDVYVRPSGQLSGGMRRRLSIAISLVGSPRVVNLDEPTTGLDPSTRHEIWGLVSSFASSERAVIITTHQMIEADTLCSRIAIISKGKLKVVGTQQHLKDNYGSGYLLQLNLLHNNEESINCALNFVKEHVHDEAKIIVRQAKTVGINLPRELSIQTIFTKMYSDDASEVGINQFLVSQSSLEDVFISLG